MYWQRKQVADSGGLHPLERVPRQSEEPPNLILQSDSQQPRPTLQCEQMEVKF